MQITGVQQLKEALFPVAARGIPSERIDAFHAFYLGVFPRWVFGGIRADLISEPSLMSDITVESDRLPELVVRGDVEYFKTTRGGTRKKDSKMRIDLALLDKRWVGNPVQKKQAIDRLVAFYSNLGGENNFLGVPEDVLVPVRDKLGASVMIELFGSPFNVAPSSAYFSALELERLFGSRGSFFSYEARAGDLALMNPPFDDKICLEAVQHILLELSRVPDVTVITILPAWTEYAPLQIAKKSLFCKSAHEAENVAFYNYGKQTALAVTKVVVLVLSNRDVPITAKQFVCAWEVWTQHKS